MKHPHIAAAVLAVILVSGCASHHSASSQPPPSGQTHDGSGVQETNTAPVTSPASTETNRLYPVTAEEKSKEFYKDHGGLRRIPPDVYRPSVDYKSGLTLIIHTNQLQLPTAPSVLPALTEEQKARIRGLQDLLTAGTNYLRVFDSFQAQYAALKDTNFTPTQVDQLTKAIKAQGEAGLAVLKPLKAYVQAKIAAEHPGASRKEALNLLDAETTNIYPITGNVVALDLTALAQFVARESKEIVSQAVTDAKMVQQNGSVFLRMRASAKLSEGQAPVPIHIDPYDTLKDSNVVQEPRISFTMSDEDRQRLTAESKVNSDLAHFITDLRNNNSDINKALETVLQGLRGDLKTWKESAADLTELEGKLEIVYSAIVPAAQSTNITDVQQQLLVGMTNAWKLATNTVQQLRAVVTAVTSTNSPDTDPTDLLFRTADTITGALTNLAALPSLAAEITTDIARLRELTAQLATNPPAAPTFQSISNALHVAAPSTEEGIEKLIQLTVARYPNLVAELKLRTGQAGKLMAASKMPPIESDPNLLDVPVSSPPEGFISLEDNIPRGGATLTIETALITRQGTNAVPIVKPLNPPLKFDIEKFGVINTWSANLIFVDRLGNVPANEQNVHFAPAPSLSWTLHYNPPPTETRQHPAWFWHTLDPGVGLNIAALSWNSGLQIGTGGHISFFHDLVTLGGGYNLQESSHGAYFFIGLGLFAAFDKIGLSNSLGR